MQRSLAHVLPALAFCACASAQKNQMTSSSESPAASAAGEADQAFLREFSETRGFQLGRPTAVRVLPDGKRVLFLRAEPRKARQHLYAMDVASGKLQSQ